MLYYPAEMEGGKLRNFNDAHLRTNRDSEARVGTLGGERSRIEVFVLLDRLIARKRKRRV